ncbi:restriction endonuclease subunit S [Citrobacter braakii]|uniref:restriction endonuclease subunit S n=1 Tax=Citrobacter braakii TaxID=57706 RepID=UPI00253F8D4C|nr:restriction endonuclease subunit S [Citrobacter braakii]EIX9045184.1 restriction endonuclease subunit S [Klebsiella oxytoca]WIF75953.1 restriction endonuclease subunit S [Citrobacter braakii]
MTVEKLITDHIDIWSSALQTRSTAGRGSNGKIDLYGIKKLRELILELAVRGKLVPQDPNDEPASELLKRIAAEKAELVKQGKIKKQKPLPEISEDKKPFELPVGWEWSSIQNLCLLENGDRSKNYPNKSTLTETGVPFVNAGHLLNGKIDEKEMTFIKESHFETLRSGKFLPGDILFCLRGSLGKSALVENISGAIASSLVIVRVYPLVNNKYVHFYFDSPISYQFIKKYDNGTAQPNLAANDLARFLIPVPPIDEQIRILGKIDNLMSLCDKLEQQSLTSLDAHQQLVETLLATLTDSQNAEEVAENWARISQHFDTLFTTESSIDALKQTILQLAVMGKLVPQDPNDEPASELLKRIEEEKAQLVKEGKIKKQKPLPPVSDEEKPFELPQGWEWCRIGDCSLSTEYGISHKTSKSSQGVPVLKMGDIQSGEVKLGGQQVIDSDIEELPYLYLEHRDILYNRTNSAELVGKAGIYLGKDNTYTYASYLIRIRTDKNGSMPEFINLNMQAPFFRLTQINPYVKQQCGQANVNGTIMKNMLVAIPPFAEQKRILLKVVQLSDICSHLKSRLQSAQQTQLRLADALTDAALN